jgi:hypothetical protein
LDCEANSDWPAPLVLRWEALPLYAVRAPSRARGPSGGFAGTPWLGMGEAGQPLDFSASIAELTMDIARRTPELRHIDVRRVLITFTQARHRGRHGLQARVTPLRFPKGHLLRTRRGVSYQVQRYFLGEHEFLYLLTFCLPRFLDQDFEDKLVTLFHELFHISPEFDGDLRRHEGRYHLHSSSKKAYDREMADYARAYLQTRPDPRLLAFLRLNFTQLRERHGQVLACMVPRPKLVPVPTPQAAAALRRPSDG